MQSIQLYAGQQAYRHIEEHGLKPADIRVLLAASGGPKWLVLSHLDQYLTEHWLENSHHPLQLVGSSIGAWRMAAYAGSDPSQAIQRLAHHQVNLPYPAQPSRCDISRLVNALLDSFIHLDDIEASPHRKLHIITARNKGFCAIQNKTLQAWAFGAVAAGNALSRKTLPWSFERFIFKSKGGSIPLTKWDNFRTYHIDLNIYNYRNSLLASGAIPVVMDGINDLHGAPRGVYRDGGMVDYHFDLPIQPTDGIVLYPHFSPLLKPGWFDKPLPWRKVSPENYSHTLLVSPSQKFVDSLPYSKIPDRKDYERMDNTTRIQYWNSVVDRSKAIADAFDQWLSSPDLIKFIQPIDSLTR